MNPKRLLTTLIISLLICSQSFAQDFTVPTSLPETKEQFVSSEKDVIAAAKWLEATQLGKEADKRQRVNAWVLAWLTNSPTVTITLQASISDIFHKNVQLLGVYLSNYCRYVLENNYSKDEVAANVFAIKAAINCYNLGGDAKKDKALQKVIDKDKDGKLEEWVKENLVKK